MEYKDIIEGWRLHGEQFSGYLQWQKIYHSLSVHVRILRN